MKPDRLFKAFADENRLRILHLLSKGELCVCNIVEVLNIGQSRVSRHLAYLRKTGLIHARRDGQWMHYSLSKPKSNFQKKLINCISDCLNEAPILKKDAAKLNKANPIKCA